ncbi:MAG TPA: hypothetical protein VJ751_02545 [Pyrinomonadaceae bacterium]|nr:hypothetical protein [Pyrinomonadaceae bacterium]
MKFARIVFLVAGIYGLIVLLPAYFLEEQVGRDFPPPITHPEYYYGFIGLAVVWQFVFLILSRDPVRYRPMMIPSILEKAVFFLPAVALYFQQRIPMMTFGFAMIDGVLGVLFLIAYLKTKHGLPS